MLLLVTFFCMLGVTLILGGLYVAFNPSTSILHFTFKTLAPTACLFLALISANLASSFGGYTLFITLALAIIIALEAFKCVNSQATLGSTLFLGISNAVSLLLLTIAGIVIAPFNIFGLLTGLLLGLGISCIVLIFKKLTPSQIIMLIINLAMAGLLIGQAIVLLISQISLGTAIVYLISALLTLFQLVFTSFLKPNKIMPYIARTARILALIGFAMSIYFMI